MNKRLYTYIILLLFIGVTSAKAQIGEQRDNFSVGVSGGYVNDNVSFQPTIKQSGLSGMTFGVVGRYITEKYFKMICGAQIEVNYSLLLHTALGVGVRHLFTGGQ